VRTGSNGGSVIPLRKKSLKLKRESTRFLLSIGGRTRLGASAN